MVKIPIRYVNCGYYIRWWFNGWHYWYFIAGNETESTEGEDYNTTAKRLITCNSNVVTFEQLEAIRTITLSSSVEIYSEGCWCKISVNDGSFLVYRNDIDGYELEITFECYLNSELVTDGIEFNSIPNVSTLTDDSLSILTNDALDIIYL